MSQVLTQTEVRELLHHLGMAPKQAKIGSAIACCEAPAMKNGEPASDFAAIGDQDLADETWGYSYGGFQIRSLRAQSGTGGIRDAELLDRTRFNCKSAIAIHASDGWKAWSTYTSGAYRAYLQDLYPPAPGTYIVLAGDTVSTIADKVGGFTWQELAAANDLQSPYTIYIGQVLTLPISSAAPASATSRSPHEESNTKPTKEK